MEMKYDKTAVLEYVSNISNLQDLMKRDMDESMNKYNACKQEYSRIYTECEEESRRAYNRVMLAESEIQMADMMMKQAMASISDSGDEDSQLDYDMINRAQEMHRQAEEDLVVAQGDYSRAQDNIRKLNAVMVKYGPTLEAESKVVNDSFRECSMIGSKAGEALEQYVGVMDKAYSALYDGSFSQSTLSGVGSPSIGVSGNGGTAGGMSKDTIGSAMTTVSGLVEAQTGNGNNRKDVASLLAGVVTADVVSYMIAGQKREFANSKVGLNQAYKAAIKANDKGVANEILRAFNNYENNQGEKNGNETERFEAKEIKFGDVSSDTLWSEQEYGDVSDKIQIADRNSNILEWSGERGNSLRVPKDKASELSQLLKNYAVEGIPYVNGDIDFSQVAKYEIEFADTEKLYTDLGKIIKFGDLMTEYTMKTRGEFNRIIRMKWQSMAKQQIVDRIMVDDQFAKDFSVKTGVDTDVIKKVSHLDLELKRNGLTLHETTDCKKIQFVPTQIHDAFKHAGGTAEMLERLINGDIHYKISS